ncbi:hypothetical protein Cpir12675_002669 [Ceratocystis pirilliformis]|uniref:Transmembrane protein n=1 Tax=Ceratocystis pirilliformis TaxID=259994 RepID=A0ABR3Z7S7_9PEZI
MVRLSNFDGLSVNSEWRSPPSSVSSSPRSSPVGGSPAEGRVRSPCQGSVADSIRTARAVLDRRSASPVGSPPGRPSFPLAPVAGPSRTLDPRRVRSAMGPKAAPFVAGLAHRVSSFPRIQPGLKSAMRPAHIALDQRPSKAVRWAFDVKDNAPLPAEKVEEEPKDLGFDLDALADAVKELMAAESLGLADALSKILAELMVSDEGDEEDDQSSETSESSSNLEEPYVPFWRPARYYKRTSIRQRSGSASPPRSSERPDPVRRVFSDTGSRDRDFFPVASALPDAEEGSAIFSASPIVRPQSTMPSHLDGSGPSSSLSFAPLGLPSFSPLVLSPSELSSPFGELSLGQFQDFSSLPGPAMSQAYGSSGSQASETGSSSAPSSPEVPSSPFAWTPLGSTYSHSLPSDVETSFASPAPLDSLPTIEAHPISGGVSSFVASSPSVPSSLERPFSAGGLLAVEFSPPSLPSLPVQEDAAISPAPLSPAAPSSPFVWTPPGVDYSRFRCPVAEATPLPLSSSTGSSPVEASTSVAAVSLESTSPLSSSSWPSPRELWEELYARSPSLISRAGSDASAPMEWSSLPALPSRDFSRITGGGSGLPRAWHSAKTSEVFVAPAVLPGSFPESPASGSSFGSPSRLSPLEAKPMGLFMGLLCGFWLAANLIFVSLVGPLAKLLFAFSGPVLVLLGALVFPASSWAVFSAFGLAFGGMDSMLQILVSWCRGALSWFRSLLLAVPWPVERSWRGVVEVAATLVGGVLVVFCLVCAEAFAWGCLLARVGWRAIRPRLADTVCSNWSSMVSVFCCLQSRFREEMAAATSTLNGTMRRAALASLTLVCSVAETVVAYLQSSIVFLVLLLWKSLVSVVFSSVSPLVSSLARFYLVPPEPVNTESLAVSSSLPLGPQPAPRRLTNFQAAGIHRIPPGWETPFSGVPHRL